MVDTGAILRLFPSNCLVQALHVVVVNPQERRIITVDHLRRRKGIEIEDDDN